MLLFMSGLTLDTHKFIKQLQAKGVSEEQAEVFVETMVNIQNAANNNSATKGEVQQFKSELKYDIDLVDKGLRHEIKLVEQNLRAEINLLKWMVGTVIIGLLTLIGKAFFG
jgi:hypothetical protein